MSSELATTGGTLIPVEQTGDDKAFAKMSSAASYLPRLQLFGSNTDAAKEGKINMGRHGMVIDKDLTDLGADVDILVCAWRPKAMDVGGEKVISLYNPDSEAFQKLQGRADLPNSGCMYGPEFLVYIPKVERFATFLMGSKTARREAPNLKALMGKAASLGVKLIKTPKYTWHATTVKPCSTPFAIPDLEEIKSTIDSFRNPPESVVEEVEESAGADRDH